MEDILEKTPLVKNKANQKPKQIEHEINKWYLYLVMMLLVVSGTVNIVLYKLQDEFVVGQYSDGRPRYFSHPYFQCSLMFMGEFLCMFIYIAKIYLFSDVIPPFQNPFVIGLPAVFDLCSSCMILIALTKTAASVLQMLCGSIVIINAFMAVQFLGRKQYFHHWISLFAIVTGVIIVGLVGIYQSDKSNTDIDAQKTTVLGVILIMVSQIITGGQLIFEEKLFIGRDLDPIFVVGSEGLIGCCFFLVLLPIFSQIECSGQLCNDGRLENMQEVFSDLKNNKIFLMQTLFNLFIIAAYNITGIMITKYASSAQRSTVDTSKALLIWIVFIFMGKEKFIWGELIGFLLLVLGTLTYNEIIEIPIRIMKIPQKENENHIQAKTK